MRDSRQLTVLRSLFRTLHPTLTSGLKNGLAPAKRMLTGAYQRSVDHDVNDRVSDPAGAGNAAKNAAKEKKRADTRIDAPSTNAPSTNAPSTNAPAPKRTKLPPLPRSLTDEHLVTELDKATSQFDLQRAGRSGAGRSRAGQNSTGQNDLAGRSSREPGKPARGRRHFSRDSLLSLLEEAKVRIQVLETELELARGTEEHIPLLTEEWSDDLPSTLSRKPD